MAGTGDLDALARELAAGEISRRAALGRLIGGAVAVGVASIPGAEAVAARRTRRCPSARKCGDKCCPAHSKCKRGKCKCNDGYTKCGKKCADLQTSVKHCGECGNACPEGRACIGGECSECTAPEDCPESGSICVSRICEGGHCGFSNAPATTQCAPATCSDGIHTPARNCDGAGNCPAGTPVSCSPYVCANGTNCFGSCGGPQECVSGGTCSGGQCQKCGNGVREGTEACDGTDFGGRTCVTELGPGATGQLACTPSCQISSANCQRCGNGIREGTEQCDGSNLGGQTCVSRGFSGGTLACNANCTFNTSGCTP